MKFILIFLLTALVARAGGETLSMQDATAIVKTRLGNDGLSGRKFTINFIPASKSHGAFYAVDFTPRIPDSAARRKDSYIGYIIDMKGIIKKETFWVSKSISIAPVNEPDYQPSAPRVIAERFRQNPFDDPITLKLQNNR